MYICILLATCFILIVSLQLQHNADYQFLNAAKLKYLMWSYVNSRFDHNVHERLCAFAAACFFRLIFTSLSLVVRTY